MSGLNVKTGRIGEHRAVDFLKTNKYHIMETNYKCPYGEIDIIAKAGDVVAFIEVKARKSLKFGNPRDNVGFKKQQHLKKAAGYFTADKNVFDTNLRFDVIEVLQLAGNTFTEINHIQNAFI